MMSLDAVLKIGGSLGRGSGLEALCREISRLGQCHRLLIVPGGGVFADQVREMYRRCSLNETAAHWMALLAMDRYGCFLNQLIAGSSITRVPHPADEQMENRRLTVLLPYSVMFQTDALPHSWDVTSDSIAAWVARRVNCPRLVLLKDVDGLFAEGETPKLIPDLTVQQLAGHAGGVDAYLSHILAASNLETWVINGQKPERLSELLSTSRTIGTRIR